MLTHLVTPWEEGCTVAGTYRSWAPGSVAPYAAIHSYGGLFYPGSALSDSRAAQTVPVVKRSLSPSNSRKSTRNVELFRLRIQWRLTPFHRDFHGFFTKFYADFLFTRTILHRIYFVSFAVFPSYFPSLWMNSSVQEKGNVVAAVWVTEFIQFLAALL